MIVNIHKIYTDYGLLSLQNIQIGTNNKLSDFNFYKITQLEKLINSTNVDWSKLSTNKKDILFQIKALSLI